MSPKIISQRHPFAQAISFVMLSLLISVGTVGKLHAGDTDSLDPENSSAEATACARFTFSVEIQRHGSIIFKPFLGIGPDVTVLETVVNHPDVAKLTCYGRPWKDVHVPEENKLSVLQTTIHDTPVRWRKFFASQCVYDAETTHLVWIAETEEGSAVARGGFAPITLAEGRISALFLHLIPEYQKEGIGTQALAKLKDLFPKVAFAAKVDPDVYYQGMFEKAGFQVVEEGMGAQAEASGGKRTYLFKG